jgi:signal transduction histidine kinase
MEPDAPLEAKEAVYGIAREALQNVVRHANATELSIKLSRSDDSLCVEVRDNGRGFSAENAGMHTLGLRSMRERAAAQGGSVEITSAPGHGTRVRAQISIRVS